MKRIFTFLFVTAVIALVISACNRGANGDARVLPYADTTGLAQFQAWKMQQETPAQPRKVVYATPVRAAATPINTGNYGSGSMRSGSENYAKTTEKKGWSKAAKGAAIGGGAGAVAGAVLIKKNRLAGGVVGGVVGAGIGYLVGRTKDKKDGR